MFNNTAEMKGVGLSEVLVSLVILSIGLLGAAKMQTHSLKEGVQSHYESRAQMVIDDLVGRMLSNQASAEAGIYEVEPGSSEPSPNCRTAACETAEMAAHDLWQVSDRLKNEASLPDSAINITFNNVLIEYEIALTWNAANSSEAYVAPICRSINNKSAGCLFTVVRI